MTPAGNLCRVRWALASTPPRTVDHDKRAHPKAIHQLREIASDRKAVFARNLDGHVKSGCRRSVERRCMRNVPSGCMTDVETLRMWHVERRCMPYVGTSCMRKTPISSKETDVDVERRCCRTSRRAALGRLPSHQNWASMSRCAACRTSRRAA